MNVTEQLARRRKKRNRRIFVQSLWYGFTGTPIFVENARKEIGNLPRTTKQQYGECLHEYTVKEAIHDNAVLGFQVEYKSTFSEEELDKTIIALDNSGELDPDTLEVAEKEARLPKKYMRMITICWRSFIRLSINLVKN